MKMVKHLLLGTAAGLVSVIGAQAADMPVKAKPVQYVKICSLYGDGFYYIPGTDTCLKLGGFLRVQAEYNAGSGGIPNSSGATHAAQARYTRDLTNDTNYRTRAALSWDVRQQTEYGTLRTYIRIGVDVTTPGGNELGAAFWDRAFIQFAGFTVGKAQSFFDIASGLGDINYHNTRVVGDTGAAGLTVWAYTAQFGNGFSGTLSAESPIGHNRAGVLDLNVTNFFAQNGAVTVDTAFSQQSTSLNGWRLPDVVANLRVDQAWGYVGVSAAIHEAGGAYYFSSNNVNNGHPNDRLGWAVSAGGRFNLPSGLLGINGCFSEGAAGYCANIGAGMQNYDASTSVGIGWLSDGVFVNGPNGGGTRIELTQVWSMVAYYQHIWSPKWRTSVYGGYVGVDYNGAATAWINSSPGTAPVCVNAGTSTASFAGFTARPGNSCNPDFGYAEIGTRTQWNPTPQLDIGLDVLYTRLDSAYKGPAVYAQNGSRPAVNWIDDQDIWSVFFRWQRNFFP